MVDVANVEQSNVGESITRRPFLTEAGEGLLDLIDPLERMRRSEQFILDTGLDAQDVVDSPVVTVPLPRYPDAWPAGGRRWSGVKPEAMWLPLMWLPASVTDRYVITDHDTGVSQVESDDVWAARIMHELSFHQFYDTGSGQWLDVLAMHGLDRYDSEDIARVRDWLEGEPDEILDAIDFAGVFEPSEQAQDWAAIMTLADFGSTQASVWVKGAAELANGARGLMEARNDATSTLTWVRQASEAALTLSALGRFYLGTCPQSDGSAGEEQWVGWFEQAQQLADVAGGGEQAVAQTHTLLLNIFDEAARVYRTYSTSGRDVLESEL